MEEKELPALFEGATHRLVHSGEPVKATHWKKDGDHPLVERYPVERREYKGLLVAGQKQKFGLRFGEWIVEDARGRLWVESSQELPATKYAALEGVQS
jgi:hypothetical protein